MPSQATSDADDYPWPQPDLLAADMAAWLSSVLHEPGLLTRLQLNLQSALARTLLAQLEALRQNELHETDLAALQARLWHELMATQMRQALQCGESLDDSVRHRLRFVADQVIAATHPDNMPLLNSAVRAAVTKSEGQSLATGIERLQADLQRNNGCLRPHYQDPRSFRVGHDVAATPGEVVFETPLMQLIHYQPVAESVWAPPLLIVPPFINKYYILDLTPSDSLVRWLVENGVDVFMISWADGRTLESDCDLGDYLGQGVDAAINFVAERLPEQKLDLVGYCVGGTLAACQAAMMGANGDNRLGRLTLLTTLLDFAEPGDLGVFISPAQLDRLEAHTGRHGVLSAGLLQRAFTLLKPDALIWRPFVERYLVGRDARPNAMLAWSEDGCAIPASAAMTYLRRMYLDNLLVTAGALHLNGNPLDLARLSAPTYAVATRKDHIAPWQGVLRSLQLLPCVDRFVLADGGHVGGIVKPPGGRPGGYVVNTNQRRGQAIESRRQSGSWWPDWLAWLTRGRRRRSASYGFMPPIEAAPGRYVRGFSQVKEGP